MLDASGLHRSLAWASVKDVGTSSCTRLYELPVYAKPGSLGGRGGGGGCAGGEGGGGCANSSLGTKARLRVDPGIATSNNAII